MVGGKIKQKLLDEIQKIGNVCFACQKTGINKATYYRWKEKDKKFKEKADEAEKIGRENISDIAEYSLLQNVKKGDQRAIEYTLGHNSSVYEPKAREVIIKHSGSTEELRRRFNQEDMDIINQSTEEIKKIGEELRNKKTNVIKFMPFKDPCNIESDKTRNENIA
jgi:hypothetical protein